MSASTIETTVTGGRTFVLRRYEGRVGFPFEVSEVDADGHHVDHRSYRLVGLAYLDFDKREADAKKRADFAVVQKSGVEFGRFLARVDAGPDKKWVSR